VVRTGSLYFHSPCFDGIVSAVLAWDFLDVQDGWTNPALRPVNYDLRETWLSQRLEQPAAVVDFLYHRGIEFWADHHPTAFLTRTARADFEKRENARLIYDQGAGSCAALLWERLYKVFGHRNVRYAELVRWADKIDSARYASVEEAMISRAPALRLTRGLALGHTAGYCESLVRALRDKSLEEVADLREARERFEQVQTLAVLGLDKFKRGAHLEEDGIVVFDVDGRGVIVSRYAPFYFFPEARYSAGILRGESGAKVTVMRNPWREFAGVPLGRIAERLGGGGHQRVGSIVLRGRRVGRGASLLSTLISEIRKAERSVATTCGHE
jgi:hypothetical protein